ncbi:pyrimidodiazepine synthase [Bactrocera oleae]|uniref:pyrimidodiazepine synthase n=1 Tax=Bactrocera oleae TaxID=104688 RepID=UPI00174C2AA3|nr:pyrimidodiazepine synthase isoform X1 [Bactrocera oleae]XP_036216850.1 pyrimidodiazepine synthase isoform X1 [Bactrocera oleae]
MSGGKHLAKGSQKPELPDDGVFRLYSMRFCPYAHRAHLVLDAKNIPHHTIYINLTEKPEWLTEVSPLGKVPALQLPKEEGNPALIESLIIAEYLDEKYPEVPLFPKDPLKKAQDKILIERFNSVISAMYKVFLGGSDAAPGALTEISKGLDIFEKELSSRGTPYFGGDKPGMLDYMIWPWCERSAMLKYLLPDKYEMDKERFGKLIAWRDLMINDPAVKGFYLDGETHAKFMKARRENVHNYDMLVNDAKRQKTC